MKLPEYASNNVVVVEPHAAVPTANPEAIASFEVIVGFFRTTSYTAEQISTDKSITAPDAPKNIDAIKIFVKSKC